MSEHHRTASYAKAARIARPRLQAQINAGGLPCVNRCKLGGIVRPGDTWDVAHIIGADQAKRMGWTEAQINAQSNLSSAHRLCNRSDGQRTTTQKRAAKRQEEQGIRPW